MQGSLEKQENPPWPILRELEIFKYYLKQIFLKGPHTLVIKDHKSSRSTFVSWPPRKLRPLEWMGLPGVSHPCCRREPPDFHHLIAGFLCNDQFSQSLLANLQPGERKFCLWHLRLSLPLGGVLLVCPSAQCLEQSGCSVVWKPRVGKKGRGRMGGEERRVRGPWGKINLRKRRVIKPSENRCSQKFK